MIAEQTWKLDASGNPIHVASTYVKEFRYDGGRARYMVRDRDPATLVALAGAEWFDYVGDEIYADYNVAPATGSVVNTAFHLPGFAKMRDGNVTYLHGDQIGTTRLLSEPTGGAASSMAFTVFGEPVSSDSSGTRYGYAGAWGYQRHGESSYLHVGARYYDPSAGRFLQRDPIGIRGGLNCYAYVFGNPLSAVDPSGHGPLGIARHGARGIIALVKGDYRTAAIRGLGVVLAAFDCPYPIVGAALCLMEAAKNSPNRGSETLDEWDRRRRKFEEDPNPAVGAKSHPPSNNCPLNPGLPCSQVDRCPNSRP